MKINKKPLVVLAPVLCDMNTFADVSFVGIKNGTIINPVRGEMAYLVR